MGFPFTTSARLVAVIQDRSRLAALAMVLATLLVLCLPITLLLGIERTYIHRYAHDSFIFLDAGWRHVNGQVPHVDYYCPFGPVVPALTGWAMALVGPTVWSIAVAKVLFGLFAVGLGLIIGGRRLSFPLLGALCVLTFSVAIGFHNLGDGYSETSHGMVYNRFAYAILCLIAIESLVPPPRGTYSRWDSAGELVAGFCLALLFFLKPNFPLEALALVLGGVLLHRTSLRRMVFFGTGATLGAIVCFSLVGFDFAALVRDYSMAAAARRTMLIGAGSGVRFFYEMSQQFENVLTPAKAVEVIRREYGGLLVLLAGALLVPNSAFEGSWGKRFGPPLVVVGWFFAALAVVFFNWQWGEIPTAAAVGLAFAELSLRAARKAEREAVVRALAAVGAAALLLVPHIEKNTLSLLYAATWDKQFPKDHAPPGSISVLPGLSDYGVGTDNGLCRDKYTAMIDDGAQLLARSGLESPRLVTLDFSHVYSFALRLPPPRGNGIVWHVGTTFSADALPESERFFGDATAVLVPKCPQNAASTRALVQAEKLELGRRFPFVAESRNWYLLSSKPFPGVEGRMRTPEAFPAGTSDPQLRSGPDLRPDDP